MRRYGLALAVMLAGCGSDSSDPPGSNLPALGAYQYHLHIPQVPATINEIDVTGTFTLTYASEDSVAGTWNVVVHRPAFPPPNDIGEPYQPAAELGFWNVDAYVVWAHQVGPGIRDMVQVAHRFSVANGALVCDRANVVLGPPADVCTLTR